MKNLELENKLAIAKCIAATGGCGGIDCVENHAMGGFGCPLRGDDGYCTGGTDKVKVAESFIKANEKSIPAKLVTNKEQVGNDGRKSNLEQILDEHKANYGSFKSSSLISQRLKAVIASSRGTARPFKADIAEALEMICHNIALIVDGCDDYSDSWYDISGYATVVADRINEENYK